MKKYIYTLVLLGLIIQPASTCTIFSLYPKNHSIEQHWIGRTFDWSYGHGLIFTNKRNVTKKGLRLIPTDVSGTWTSKHGSVTFNQFGREFPTGGMNEEGLVVEALELMTSVFPSIDSRASLNELQFIQYLLDNFSTVESVADGLKSVRLSPVGSKLHYFVCDTNKCMTIEFVNGELVTHQGNLQISSLANNTYEEHLTYARDYITFGGTKPVKQDSKNSLDRFVRASYNAKFINEHTDPVAAIFGMLSDVGTINNRWQIIYNQNDKTIKFRTTAKIGLIRSLALKKFDFSCQKSGQYFDLDNDIEGEINDDFLAYDSTYNHAIIKKSVEMQKLPAPLADRLAIYPSETVCNE
ncbi:MAG: linear amide C-N hydrolase [Bacteriovorax sp.]|nr:linear amide C-N hydrolase [Bacteriovorax sp.]